MTVTDAKANGEFIMDQNIPAVITMAEMKIQLQTIKIDLLVEYFIGSLILTPVTPFIIVSGFLNVIAVRYTPSLGNDFFQLSSTFLARVFCPMTPTPQSKQIPMIISIMGLFHALQTLVLQSLRAVTPWLQLIRFRTYPRIRGQTFDRKDPKGDISNK